MPPMEPPASSSGGTPRIDFASAEPDLYGPEPLVAAAGRLIHLASRIRAMPLGPDLGGLRRLVIQELDAFGQRARTLGLEPKSVQLGHYILCAFMDDAVMSTPWGANSPWSQQSLLAVYHNDTHGGDRMFQFAERMEQDPNREPRLMELLYQCLSLGFEGRAALDPRGESLLHQRRARLAAAIAGRSGPPPGDLSPQWRGNQIAAGRYAPQIPLWAVLSGLAVIGLLIFAALLFRLNAQSDAALAALNQAVGTAEIVPAPPPAQSATPTFTRMQEILAPDIKSGRLQLLREGNEIVIRLRNQGLFDSAQAEPSSAWSDTFERLAKAANLSKGPMQVEGHTDDQAIRSLLFPSNQELSQARADAVADSIEAAGLSDGSRIETTGLGSTQPMAKNDSEDGRRQNRRVEIRVVNDIAWR
jgi:type VI secretion system protein ImpK